MELIATLIVKPYLTVSTNYFYLIYFPKNKTLVATRFPAKNMTCNGFDIYIGLHACSHRRKYALQFNLTKPSLINTGITIFYLLCIFV